MHTDTRVVNANPRSLAAVRVTTALATWPKQFMKSLDKVYDAVRAGKVHQTGHNVMVYRPRPDGLVDIDCGVEVATKFDGLGEVVYCETAAGLAVATTHIDPYGQLGVGHKAIRDWSRDNGHRLTATCWEIYGDWNEDPAKLSTELFHLLG
jgi:effector-binding domain-containing protein